MLTNIASGKPNMYNKFESVEEDKNEDDDDMSNISDLKTPNSSVKHTPVSAKGSSMVKNSTSSFD